MGQAFATARATHLIFVVIGDLKMLSFVRSEK
jgi:hypothetical protein